MRRSPERSYEMEYVMRKRNFLSRTLRWMFEVEAVCAVVSLMVPSAFFTVNYEGNLHFKAFSL